MRVAFDVSNTRGQRTGIGAHTEQLIRALESYCPEISAIELDDSATTDQRTDRRILREQFRLSGLADQAHADLLHLTGFAAPLRSRVPVILTVHDLIGVLFAEHFPPPSRFYWSRYLPYTLHSARHLITVSESTKRDMVRLASIPPERISVILPGLDARWRVLEGGTRREELRTRLKLPERFFLFVGTLEPRKGIDTLIAAYSQVARHVPEQLVIVGKRGWGCESLFSQVTSLQLEPRVHFLNYLTDDDLVAVYNLATALVFPSRYEGFGFPPLEAMACGAPVVSSNASSLPEVIGEAGVLVAPDDTNGFAQAMGEIAGSNELRAQLRAKGLARAATFSWERAAHATAVCYAAVLNSTGTLLNRQN